MEGRKWKSEMKVRDGRLEMEVGDGRLEWKSEMEMSEMKEIEYGIIVPYCILKPQRFRRTPTSAGCLRQSRLK